MGPDDIEISENSCFSSFDHSTVDYSYYYLLSDTIKLLKSSCSSFDLYID